ncbi:Hsp20/alpha crystallin family protein [Virgibacillus chiguensis]|uniref:HSP20 family protein n=1 Tax=Virgibacillus chiguensis TaxID=411959 RepID=A0A1M5WSS2_9BACI|nr:Hsp20/alpha crystallin family protein [Virgibacillus chiguensis]SHH90462.1 HSP20 family protein [Virgibacillus chiguensis]
MKPIKRWNRDDQPLRKFKNELDGMFERFFDDPFFSNNSLWNRQQGGSLACNIREKKDKYIVEAEIPGIDPSEIEVEIEDNIVTIKGEKKQQIETEDNDTEMRVVEHSYGSFQRSFTLPDNVNTDKINADHKNGMLYLHIPKTKESKKRRIKINGQ